ncbi:MAG: CehA/McbA family metallohydrolase [Phycisphaerae bacterium]|nr:CehA/McbA family metallohydrolase [Phycisphaerae bacterium]
MRNGSKLRCGRERRGLTVGGAAAIVVGLWAAVVFPGTAIAQNQSQPNPADEPPGLKEFVSELMLNCPFLLDGPQRARFDELNREYREVGSKDKNVETPADRVKMAETRARIAAEVAENLEKFDQVIRVTVRDRSVESTLKGPVTLPGTTGALLLRIDAGGSGQTHYTTASHDLSYIWADPIKVKIAPTGVTWAIVAFSRMPANRTTKQIDFCARWEDKDKNFARMTVDLMTPPQGRLRVNVVSDADGQPTPAMVRLTWKPDGNPVAPSNALDYGTQFDTNGTNSGRRFTSQPGRFRGIWWVVPGPFDMQLPPGEYEIAARRGPEHLPVFETITIKSNEVLERTLRIKQWTDMAKLGWYSGDAHIHCQILSDDDASRLMIWAQAEDVHLVNVVKMGDLFRTYFEQRGFGKEYRVEQGGYTLSPGQECPRTSKLGHVLAMNTTSMVRDVDKYFLYDWVFDIVHKQGGLTGYAHVHNDGYWVHCDMAMNVPKKKVDFAEMLQFNVMGTPLYYMFLNLGYRLTAAAGSDVPWGGTIGDVRMYAYAGKGPFSTDAWFEGVRKGHTFVTNGPMVELLVDDAMPGDEIHVSKNRKLHVKARTWGHTERKQLPALLEVVVQGDVIKRVESNDGKTDTLTAEFDIDAGHGFWIAARAYAADGAKAHTTPVYVIRDGLRFWKYEEASKLIDQMVFYLGEIETKTLNIQKTDETARQMSFETRQWSNQASELLKRIADAHKIYDELRKTIEEERPLRAKD